MFKQILLIGNGKLSKSLQKYLTDYNVIVFDKDNIDKINLYQGDLLIDCSLKDGFDNYVDYVIKHHIPLIIAATNHNQDQLEKMKEISLSLPVVKSNNFSIGITLFNMILSQYKNIINKYDLYLFDFHHQNKKDAPSGTANHFISIINQDLPCYSIRSKNIIGEHTIKMFSDDEEITLTHKVTSSDLFSKGILMAINFIFTKKTGFYTMEDILNEIK